MGGVMAQLPNLSGWIYQMGVIQAMGSLLLQMAATPALSGQPGAHLNLKELKNHGVISFGEYLKCVFPRLFTG